jgi:hypothetical protein
MNEKIEINEKTQEKRERRQKYDEIPSRDLADNIFTL